MTAHDKQQTPSPSSQLMGSEQAIAIIEARLPLYTDIGQINALRECISSIRGASGHHKAAGNDVPEELMSRTFAVQHNPNCPSPYLVRLPGKSGIIDMKPHGDGVGFVRHQTDDVLGFGQTFGEAARAALATATECGE